MKYIKKSVLLGLVLLSVGTVVTPTASVFASETGNEEVSILAEEGNAFSDEVLNRFGYLNSLSPHDLLEVMRESGIDVESIFSESEIEKYDSQTMTLRAGTTKLVTINSTTKDLYLNSVLAAVVKVGGVGAVVALVPSLSVIGGVILKAYISKSMDTSRGIVIRFKKYNGASGGMNGYYWAIMSVRKQ